MSFSCIKLGLSFLWLTLAEVTVVVKLMVNFFNVGEMFRNVVKKLFYTRTLNQKTRQTWYSSHVKLRKNILSCINPVEKLSLVRAHWQRSIETDQVLKSFVFIFFQFYFLSLTCAEQLTLWWNKWSLFDSIVKYQSFL